ncbi:MAG TPA: hypothetical protein VLS93_00055 [Anaeromyxobacteraceae bacterium]|nr:hypothetical protein [Anaeromyxobacteraceae bacterium]
MEKIGWRLADGTAWVERLMGLSLAEIAAGTSGDDEGREGFRRRSKAQRETYRAWSDARNRMGRWPFAAEWREWSPDEVGAAVAFLAAIGDAPR